MVTLKDTVDRLIANLEAVRDSPDRVRDLLEAAIRGERLLAVEAISRHAWKWGLKEFAEALHLPQSDANVQHRFKMLNEANRSLKALDRQTIELITSR